jgi:hypothetical protein
MSLRNTGINQNFDPVMSFTSVTFVERRRAAP